MDEKKDGKQQKRLEENKEGTIKEETDCKERKMEKEKQRNIGRKVRGEKEKRKIGWK